MACWMCVYGKAKYQTDYLSGDWGPFSNKPGYCTKNPQWVDVTAKHYCHDLKMNSPQLPGYWHDRIEDDAELIKRLKDERKKLKDRNHVLNQKLREKKHV